MSSKLGMYDHLDDGKLNVSLAFDELAILIELENYGVHRMLSALVRARRQSMKGTRPDVLMDVIEEMLNDGLY